MSPSTAMRALAGQQPRASRAPRASRTGSRCRRRRRGARPTRAAAISPRCGAGAQTGPPPRRSPRPRRRPRRRSRRPRGSSTTWCGPGRPAARPAPRPRASPGGSGCRRPPTTTSLAPYVGGAPRARSARTRPRWRAAIAATRGIVGVGDEGALRASGPRGSRPWRRRSRRASAKNSRCASGDEQDRGHVGLEGARERREIARLRYPHLADHPLGRARQVHDRQREADLAVLVARRLLDGEAAREDRRRELLRRRLAGRAGDRGQAEARRAA